MHDGTPPHFVHIVRQHLDQTFGEQWIRRGGPVNWPARSPDLNPQDIWLWRHLKTSVYSAPINDLEVLQQRAENACQEIPVKPGIFDRVRTCVRRRDESLIEIHANHTHRTCCTDHTHIAHISVGTDFWTYVDWDSFAQLSEYYTP
jgi:hypothetical protein